METYPLANFPCACVSDILVFGVIVTKKMSMPLLLQIRVLVSACPEELTEDDLKKALERKTEYKKKTCLPFSTPIAARVYYR